MCPKEAPRRQGEPRLACVSPVAKTGRPWKVAGSACGNHIQQAKASTYRQEIAAVFKYSSKSRFVCL